MNRVWGSLGLARKSCTRARVDSLPGFTAMTTWKDGLWGRALMVATVSCGWRSGFAVCSSGGGCESEATDSASKLEATWTSIDGGVCINVDLSSFDMSCNVDSDCARVSSGTLCSANCLCGGSTINIDGEARYRATVASLPHSGPPCNCGAFNKPRCVHGPTGGTCTLCPPYIGAARGAAGCPDAG
jgi:hypothetical protein